MYCAACCFVYAHTSAGLACKARFVAKSPHLRYQHGRGGSYEHDTVDTAKSCCRQLYSCTACCRLFLCHAPCVVSLSSLLPPRRMGAEGTCKSFITSTLCTTRSALLIRRFVQVATNPTFPLCFAAGQQIRSRRARGSARPGVAVRTGRLRCIVSSHCGTGGLSTVSGLHLVCIERVKNCHQRASY